MTSATSATSATVPQYQFTIRDIVNSIVDEYARKHKPAAGQLGLFENPAERQKPLFSKKVDDEAGRWVTMRGARVFISGEDGRIMKGPKALMGKTKEQIERESAGKEGGERKPKPKGLAEMGKISGGRKENRQQKLFEELNPGFKFEDDEDEDFKVVEPVDFEGAMGKDFEAAMDEASSSPAEELPKTGDWMSYKGTPFKVAHSFEDKQTGRTVIVPSYETFKEHGRVPSEVAIGEVQKFNKDEEPSFTLDSAPEKPAAKPPSFGNPDPATKQGALFDTGKNTKDLKGQELLFNSDAGDLNNPKTMENKVQANPFREKMDSLNRKADSLTPGGSAFDKSMASAFPLGVGRSGNASSQRTSKQAAKRIDQSVNNALKSIEVRKQANSLNGRAEAFDRGEIDQHGNRTDLGKQKDAEQLAKSQERKQTVQNFWDSHADFMKATLKPGDSLALAANPSNTVTVKRVNKTGITSEGGSKWVYADLIPLKDGKPMESKEVISAVNEWKKGQETPKVEEGPNDGDTNAEGLVFRNGRWHRDGEEISPSDIAAKASENGENIWTAAKRELGVNSMAEIPPELRKELGDAMAAASAGKAPAPKPPSPGRQKAMEKQAEKMNQDEVQVEAEPEKQAEPEPKPEPEPSPKESMKEKAKSAARKVISKKMEDFGEFIPGARKERAKKIGPREKKEDSNGDKEKKPGWKNRYSVSEIVSSSTRSEVGKFHVTDSRSKDYFGQNKSLGVFNTREEAEAAIPQLEVNRNHSIRRINEGQPKDQAEWDKYVEAKNAWAKRFETATAEEARKIPFPDRPERVGEEYAIVRNVSDKKRPTVKGGFSSQQEAENWMKENPESIIEHQFPSYETYQYLDRVERSGPEFRKSNVDPEDFQKAFKTHGGQFGKWNSGKDGQTSLNHAYDSFHDLADVLGVAPEAVSLNGKLAMAFGARGTGGKDSARADYEPGLDVINLTKMKGAGSLAHEWAHALDFGIAKETNQGRKELSGATAIQEKYLKARPEVREALKGLTDAMFTTEVELKKDAGKEGKAVDRQKEAIRSMVGSLEKGWTSTYGKKKKPLNETELARWNELKERLVNGDMGEVTWKSSDRGYGGRYSSDLLEEMNGMHKKVTGRSFMTNDDNSAGKNIYWAAKRLQDAEDRLKEATSSEVKTGRTRSSFMNEAIDLDGTSKGDYYTKPEEMFARAFESYVHDKLESAGRRSDYLIGKGKTDNRVYRAFGMPGPFPEGEERKKINAAFDNFFEKLRGNELKAAEKKNGGAEKYSRSSYNVAASETMHTIVDRYCHDEPVLVDKYAHPLVHAAVGAGAMALANKAFSGPMRSVAHMAIAAAMSAWMSSAMAANGIPAAQGQQPPAAMTPFQKEKAGNNAFDQVVQNAIAKHEQRSKAAETAPPSAAQLAADAVVGDAVNGGSGNSHGDGNQNPETQSAGKEGGRAVRPLKERPDSQGASSSSGGGSGSFNSDHPRHPAGAPQSKGGEFAPKGGEESSAPETSSSPAESSSDSETSSPRNYPDNLNKPSSEQTNYSPPERAIEPTDSVKPTEPQKSPEQLYQEHLAKIAATKVDPGEHRERPDRRAAWQQNVQAMTQQLLADKQYKKDEAKKFKETQKATSFNPSELEAESSKMADENEFDVPKPKEEDFQTEKSLDRMRRWRAQRPTGSGPGYESEIAKWKSEQPSFENAMKEWNRKYGASKASITKATKKNILSDIALENDLDHETLSNAVQDELKMVLPAHQRQEEARQYVAHLGWDAGRINRKEDSYKDHSTTNLDENASEWAGLFPEIAGSDESEWVAKMWDLSKKGKQDPPSASDEDFVRSVAKRLVDQGYASSFSAGEGEGFGDGNDDEDFQPVHGQPGDVDYTPFHRQAVIGLVVDRYMRLAGIC